jgi:hypothetical protein
VIHRLDRPGLATQSVGALRTSAPTVRVSDPSLGQAVELEDRQAEQVEALEDREQFRPVS